jgi:hypothetical protein
MSKGSKAHKRTISAMSYNSPTSVAEGKDFDVETEAKFINKNLTTLGRIF